MAARDEERPKRRAGRPAITLEGQESKLISIAMDLVERKMRDGTATSQEVTHFLKLGTTRELLEKDKLRQENALLKAKVEQLQSNQRSEQLFEDAINAMRAYNGQDPITIQDDGYED